jgi:ATP-dependent RNA helicase HrpB
MLRSEGRAFPVRVEYPAPRRGEDASAALRRVTLRALEESGGDVLAFLPGRREIALAQRMLAGVVQGAEVIPLHGELALAEQHAALAPAEGGMRRVILATNVAESSITVPGVRVVIDTGLAREPRFDPASGLTRLQTVNISQASADQRAGRAGRVAPGIAYRLWPESQRLEPARTPEIAQAELSDLALELAAWGVGTDVSALRWLDAPPSGALAAARELLQRLGALDADLHITPPGREMLRLGTVPRLAAAALRAPENLRGLTADLLALLEARSPLRGEFNDDVRARVDALHVWRDGGAHATRRADAGALSAIEQTARGWRKRFGVRHGASGTPGALAVGNLLLHAFPDRVAKQDAKDPRRYLLANGRGARLHEASTLFGEPWLIVVEARFDTRDSLILAAAPFDALLLESDYPQRFTHERVLRVNADDAVEAFEETRFDAIVLSRRALPASAEDALPALLATIRARGIGALPWSDAATRLRARVAWLRSVMPEAGLPDVSDAALLAALEHWLAPALAGRRKLDALSAQALSEAFSALLDYGRRKLLDEAAPDALTVPSGMTRKLDYGSVAADAAPGGIAPEASGAARHSPVLAVKLQELFGLAETPRVARGRVPVTLHLLSPAGRPIQVTQDLRGFWERTYPEVKKELKGRYPRHPWPDDPWSATPTHRPKPR